MQVRNLKFAVGDRTPRVWHPAGRAVTLFFDNLSVFFPAGETFFITSVKAFRDRVERGSALDDEVKGFTAQEGMHSREHRRYNAMLVEQGFPVVDMEKRVERILDFARRLPKRWQLSATCALEHFTALLADYLLGDPRLLEGADPVMSALWKWHAAEENEHKAVAYDVYRLVGAPYPERVAVMIGASLIFWAKIVEQQARMMRADGILWDAGEWRKLLHFLLVEPGGFGNVFRLYLAYYRPDFHPWQHDNRALLEAWKRELAQNPAYLSAA